MTGLRRRPSWDISGLVIGPSEVRAPQTVTGQETGRGESLGCINALYVGIIPANTSPAPAALCRKSIRRKDYAE